MVDIYICLVINIYLFHLSRERQNKLSHRFFKLYILKVKDKKKEAPSNEDAFLLFGGERGIRTLVC